MKDAETLVLPRLKWVEASVEDPWGEGRSVSPGRPPTDTRAWRLAAWVLPALVTAGLSIARGGVTEPGARHAGAWTPALSSWSEAWPMLRSSEAVLVPYRLLLHGWADLVGTSELALRLPSILAMTAAAALVGALAARLFVPGTGVLAGLIFALLPTSTAYGQPTRPYAMALLVAVLATWLLARAADVPWWWRFVLYAGAVAVLGLCNVFALLLLVGHGWAMLAFRRDVALRWLVAAIVGVLPAAALVWYAAQHGVRLARDADPTAAALAAAPASLFGVPAVGAVLVTLALFSLPLRRSAAIFTAWAVAPPVLLLLAAQAVPVWQPQYLLFTVPAWATLGAAALARLPAPWSASRHPGAGGRRAAHTS